ncbi:hypothetical protein [Arthrobacter mobilis]|uniref:hypothetical protein n=1 Tax=Arthrobacter mobilis TaxID=2724944 RepID=UPI001444BFD1|nr:hypothetical protein [Arthrobacter mobilis]
MFELKPHLVEEGFKLSIDPLFIEKVYDSAGFYLNPPESAVVLCVDEKSQVQALARYQPAFPMMSACQRGAPATTPDTAPPCSRSSTPPRAGYLQPAPHGPGRRVQKFLARIDAQVSEHLLHSRARPQRPPSGRSGWYARLSGSEPAGRPDHSTRHGSHEDAFRIAVC